MNRSARTIRTRAKALTQPAPARVSMCAAGANQEPFRVGKSDEGLILAEKEELPDMLTKMKSQGYDIHSFAFKGDQWTREAATKWLADGGYDTAEIADGEDGAFVATEKSASEIPEGFDTRVIQTDDGVSVTLIKEATTTAAAEVVPAEEGVTSEVQPVATDKDDISDAALSDGGAAMPEQNEKTKKGKKKPPASEEQGSTASDEGTSSSKEDLTELLVRIKSVKEERRKGFYDLIQLGNLVQDLKCFATSYSWNAEYAALFGQDDDAALFQTVMEQVKAGALAIVKAFEVMAVDVVEDMTEAFAADTVKSDKEETEAPAPETAAEAAPEVTPEPETPVVEETPAEAVPEADATQKSDEPPAWASAFITSVTKSVEDLSGKVNEVVATQAALKAETEATAAKAAAVPAQSRKSVDPERGETQQSSATKSETSQGISDLRLKAALGI